MTSALCSIISALGGADVMGYSMGARIAAFFALPIRGRLRRVILGGLGIHLVDGADCPRASHRRLRRLHSRMFTIPWDACFARSPSRPGRI